MGRISVWRARWSARSRRHRAGVAAAVVVAAGLVGVGINAASGPGNRAPVVWHDHVADPGPTTAPSTATP
jgi:hypothetical protein